MSEGRRPGWAFAGLLIWAVGVQLNETVAAIGFGLTSVWAISDATLSLSASGSDRRAVLTAMRALWPLWLWIGWALLASALGHGFTGAGVARTLDWVGVATAAAAAAAIDRRQRRIVLVAALGVLVASSCVAGLQHFGLWPGPEWFAPLRWTKIGFGRVYEPVPGAEGRFMAGGLIFHRLKFAHVGSLAVLWALVVGIDLRGRPRAWALAAAGIGAVAILAFPYARAASAALLGAIAVTVLWHLENRRLAFGVVLAVVLAGAATIALRPSLRERFLLSGTAHGSGDRAELLESGLRAVRAHPWIGTGVGKFRPVRLPGPEHAAVRARQPGQGAQPAALDRRRDRARRPRPVREPARRADPKASGAEHRRGRRAREPRVLPAPRARARPALPGRVLARARALARGRARRERRFSRAAPRAPMSRR